MSLHLLSQCVQLYRYSCCSCEVQLFAASYGCAASPCLVNMCVLGPVLSGWLISVQGAEGGLWHTRHMSVCSSDCQISKCFCGIVNLFFLCSLSMKALLLMYEEAAGQSAGKSDAGNLVTPKKPSQSYNGAANTYVHILCISLKYFFKHIHENLLL